MGKSWENIWVNGWLMDGWQNLGLVVSNLTGLLSISYMGCLPSYWRTPSFFKMIKTSVKTTKQIWVWVNTYRYIFSGMNIHKSQLFLGFTRYQGFDPSPYELGWWSISIRDDPIALLIHPDLCRLVRILRSGRDFPGRETSSNSCPVGCLKFFGYYFPNPN